MFNLSIQSAFLVQNVVPLPEFDSPYDYSVLYIHAFKPSGQVSYACNAGECRCNPVTGIIGA